MKQIIFLLIGVFSCVSCTQIHYFGKSYSETAYVDIYLRSEDIPYDFEVIGRLEGHSDWSSVENIQRTIEKKARKKGGDAVILEGMGMQYINPVYTSTKEVKKTENGQTTTVLESETVTEKRILRGTVIKYKKNTEKISENN